MPRWTPFAKGCGMNDWLEFFEHTITTIQEQLSVVLDASGCREGWLQGEFFRAGVSRQLQVNRHSLGDGTKADLSCSEPAMVAELKVVGALDSTKMQGLIERDVERMRQQRREGVDAYMILVVPDRESPPNKLDTFLRQCDFPNCQMVVKKYPQFTVKIWQLKPESA